MNAFEVIGYIIALSFVIKGRKWDVLVPKKRYELWTRIVWKFTCQFFSWFTGGVNDLIWLFCHSPILHSFRNIDTGKTN